MKHAVVVIEALVPVEPARVANLGSELLVLAQKVFA